MNVNIDDILKLEGEMAHLVEALKSGETIEVWEGEGLHNGWCQTKQINTSRPVGDYRVVTSN